jgi:proteasome lid subunit RPN8/RPN11
MELKLKTAELRSMYEHALEEYPSECIGVVTGLPDDAAAREVSRLTNSQNDFHAKDPGNFRRDARTGYFVDPKEVLNLARETEKRGDKILAFYHSHPDHDAYFSKEDFAGAVMWGEPVYPGAVYIVISVSDGVVKEAVQFSWDGKGYSACGKLPVES